MLAAEAIGKGATGSAACMQDAAEEHEAEQEDEGAPEAKRADVADLRELLPKRSEPSTGLFSAAAAGLPEFIAIAEEDEEQAEADEVEAAVPFEPAPADAEEPAAA